MRIRDPASVRAARLYWKTYDPANLANPSINNRFGVDFELVRAFKPSTTNDGDSWDSALELARVVKYAEGLLQSPQQPHAADAGLVTVDGQPVISDALSEVEIAISIAQMGEDHGGPRGDGEAQRGGTEGVLEAGPQLVTAEGVGSESGVQVTSTAENTPERTLFVPPADGDTQLPASVNELPVQDVVVVDGGVVEGVSDGLVGVGVAT